MLDITGNKEMTANGFENEKQTPDSNCQLCSYPVSSQIEKSKLHRLEKFGESVSKFGANFALCNAAGELVLLCESGRFVSSEKSIIDSCLTVIQSDSKNQKLSANQPSLINNRFLVVVLQSGPCASKFVASIDLGEKGLQNENNPDMPCELYSMILNQMLELLAENFEAVAKTEQQVEMVSTELAQVYEELVLLLKLSTNMKVTEPDTSFLQMACDSLTDIITVEGIAILLERFVEGEKKLLLAAGSGLIDLDEQMSTVLYHRLEEQIISGKDALLDSEVDSPLKYSWPSNIKNVIAVPLFGKGKSKLRFDEETKEQGRIIGLMVAINRIDKPDFDTTDVKLFNSVANECAVFAENGRLFRDLKELFIGSLRALTSSIDAKDQYTRGHSERVALISRWIAERLAEQDLAEHEQIHKIYLAGLLHDIGKMGISEAVLRKKGKLTEQEFNHIKTHPLIGADILKGIKQMRDIVPGVLSHHEQMDGKGYPNGLTEEQIPLIAKIIRLADCFDAMTSKRTYRRAMTVKEALAEIEAGLGTQFDEKIGRIFINSDICQLWNMVQDGFAEVYGTDNLSEYGTIAVGTLIG